MLSGWHPDPEFLDSAGNSRELALARAITAAALFARALDRLAAAKGTLLNDAIVAEEAELED